MKTTIKGRGEKILIIDDEEPVRKITERILCSLGYNVITAKNGVEALQIFEKQAADIDLAVIDLLMPEMTGPDVFINLRERRPDLPIIFVTGFDADSELRLFQKSKDDFMVILQKPFTRDSLGKKVRELLQR